MLHKNGGADTFDSVLIGERWEHGKPDSKPWHMKPFMGVLVGTVCYSPDDSCIIGNYM